MCSGVAGFGTSNRWMSRSQQHQNPFRLCVIERNDVVLSDVVRFRSCYVDTVSLQQHGVYVCTFIYKTVHQLSQDSDTHVLSLSLSYNNQHVRVRSSRRAAPRRQSGAVIWQYSDGDPTNGRASNAGGVGTNRDSRRISGFIACCQRCDRQVLFT